MASVQCYKTYEENCQQRTQHNSLGQKVSDLFKGHHHSTQIQTQCSTQTHASHGAAMKCNGNGRTKREHKKNLVQKIKDGLSGHSSDSCSSESDSDDDNSHNRKN